MSRIRTVPARTAHDRLREGPVELGCGETHNEYVDGSDWAYLRGGHGPSWESTAESSLWCEHALTPTRVLILAG